MTHLVTYSDDRMTISAESLCRSAKLFGCDTATISYSQYLDMTFISMASPTINEQKGAGLYIWKPFVVWDIMNALKDGEILIYADAGQTIISNVQPVIDAMDSDVMMFSNGWNHMDWCKMDVAAAICPMSHNSTWLNNEKQVQASLIFFRLSAESRKFVKEWMLYCLMPGFCDNSPSKLPNDPGFQETRWDQSVLTCLQIKYGYKLHWFPSSTNWHRKADHPNDSYPAIVNHHRKRNPGATGGSVKLSVRVHRLLGLLGLLGLCRLLWFLDRRFRGAGIGLSVYKCMQIAKEANHGLVLFEDDVVFTRPPGFFPPPMGALSAHLGVNIMGNWKMPESCGLKDWALLHNCWQSHASTYGLECINFILDNMNPNEISDKQPIFDEWFRLNLLPKGRSYVMKPMIAYQRPSWSDIWQTEANYVDCFHEGNRYLSTL